MKTPIILKAAVAVAVGLLLFSCTKKTELSLSTKSLTFDADITVAQPQTVTVTTNAAWHASKTADWLYIDPVSGPESGKFTVSVVNYNKELSDRTAQITVVADDLTEVITVTQKALVPVLSVAANGWDINAPIPAKGTGARQLVITSNVPWTLTVTGGGDWFTYAPDSGNENGYVSMGWHANYEFEERSVKLDFSAAGGQTASITFKQLAAEPSRQIDSLALVAIYNASKGAEWTKGNWDLTQEISTWTGVKLNENNRVTELKLTTTVAIPEEWKLPDEIAKLTELTDLRINKQKLTGEIPESIFKLSKLQILYLQGNLFTGAIPASISKLTELTQLYVDQNANMSGSIPKEIGQLKKLARLNISQSGIGGEIPVELGQCEGLEQFMAFKCQLSGELPDIWDLPKLQTVMVHTCPGLTGELPASLGKVKKISTAGPSIQVHSCNFTGNIPESFAGLDGGEKKVQVHVYGNKMSGVIPASVQAHKDFASWKINPQQEGYGLTTE